MSPAGALLSLALLAGVQSAEATAGGAVTLRYFGHAFFLVTSGEGVRVVLDPFTDIGYPMPEVEGDLVAISHEAPDHNNALLVRGAPEVLRGLERSGRGWTRAQRVLRDVWVAALPAYHDKVQGKERGLNTVFLVEASGLRIAHLSDVGDMPPEETIRALGRVDVLLVPVGGGHGLDATDASRVVERLRPAIAIPIHYKTAATAHSLMADERPFLEGKPRLRRVGSTLQLRRMSLPVETEIWVMDYR